MGGRRSCEPQPPDPGRVSGAADLSGRRDQQRGQVYAWENRVVAPRDPTTVRFPDAQRMVDAIWTDMGLRYPPEVERLPAQATATLASATRLSLKLREQTPAWCLLHELAHALSATHDGRSDGHGPIFMGLYVQLLVRYLRLDKAQLLHSLRDAGISVFLEASPVFVDS